MTGSASVTTLLLMLAAPGLAQDVTATTPAPAPSPTPAPRGVAGPPDGMIGPGPATRPPFVVPQPLPQPVTPAPTPAPSPAATTPSPASPDRAPPRRTETPRPRAAGDVSPAPPASGIGPPLPDLGTGAPATGGNDILTSAPADDTTTTGLPDITDADWTLPAAIGGALLFLIGALLWWRGRSRKPVLRLTDQSEPEPAASPQPTPAPAAAPSPAPAPAKARAVTGRRADISIAFEPLAASSTLLNLRLRYAFHLTNRGNVDAVEVGLRIGMFSGNQASEAGVGQWLSMEGQAPHHAIGVIAPGETRMVEGELVAPLDALNALVLDGRSMAIPLIAADVRYSHPDSEALLFGQTGRAFVVGREPPAQRGTAAKLAPFRLDQGPTVYAPLGMRDTGIGRIA